VDVFLFLALLSLGCASLLFSLRRPKPAPARLLPYRLVFPREGELSAPRSTALFEALAPLLRYHETELAAEIGSANGRVDYRLYLEEAFEPSLRGLLSSHFPEARTERIAAEEGTEPHQVSHGKPPDGRDKARSLFFYLSFRADPAAEPKAAASPEVAPLLSVLGTLPSLPAPSGFRLLLRPSAGTGRTGRTSRTLWQRVKPWADDLFRAVLWPGGSGTPVSLLSGAASPPEAPRYEARLVAWSAGEAEPARRSLESLAAQMEAAFFQATGLRLKPSGKLGEAALPLERLPAFPLSSEGAGRLFHLPAAGLPFLHREGSRQSSPPAAAPISGPDELPEVTLGEALSPEGTVPFGMPRAARRLHAYVVGKTGTGKSTLLAHLIRQDLEADRGFALLDPHGDLAENVLASVPRSRTSDVIYLNPQDTGWPVGFNPLRCEKPEDRPLVASAVLSILKRLYGEFWGPRMEHILKHALLALLETPRPSFLDVPRLLTDPAFRHQALRFVRDPVVRAFFRDEFDRYDPRFRTEAIAPILNKIGGYLASPAVRNIVGQSDARLDLRQVMDEGMALVANLSMGRIGEENAALLGGLLVAGMHLAALSRKDLPEESRRDFCLYADEFQHFAGDAFPSILSEARKFRLSLILSHQYLNQVPGPLLDAVFGNVGSLAVFRVGSGDAPRLAKELGSAFDTEDLLALPNYRFCFRTLHVGAPLPAFSARTLPFPEGMTDPAAVILASRKRWGKPRAAVEMEIADRLGGRLF
jgi:hypothetical protein